MNKFIISSVVAVVAMFGMWGTTMAVDPTPTVAPKPVLNMTKTALALEVAPGGLVAYTIGVVNSGFANSDTISLTDVLPPGVHWTMDDSESCSLSNTFGTQILTCKFALNKRHLNDSQTEFVNPSFSVTVYGLAGECGERYVNQALATHNGNVLIAGPAIITTTACPIPVTPTPVPPTPTATVAVPTQTPQIIYVEVTPTPKPVVVPKPPSTGNSAQSDSGTNWPLLLGVSLGVALLVILVGSYLMTKDTEDINEEH